MTAMIWADPLQRAHYYYGSSGRSEVPTMDTEYGLEDGPSAGDVFGWIFDPVGSAIKAGLNASQPKGGNTPQEQADYAAKVAGLKADAASKGTMTQSPADIAGYQQKAAMINAGLLPVTGAPKGSVPVFPGLLPGSGIPGPMVGGALQQGIDQVVNAMPSPSVLGSLFGAGMGSPIFGTGPMSGPFGNLLNSKYGQPMLPSAMNGAPGNWMPNALASDPTWNALANHSEQVGRAVVRRVLGVSQPQLDTIQNLLKLRQNQVQATAEHKVIMSDADFKAAVLTHLSRMSKVMGVAPSTAFGGMGMSIAGKPLIKTY